ncbi:MAG: hypothetical protein ACTHMI_15420 [Mucilaginibacter sp.]
MENNGTTLVIFTREKGELLLQNTVTSFFKACNYQFSQVILAVDGVVNEASFSYINPDLIVYYYKRKGYVHSISTAIMHIKTPFFSGLRVLFPDNLVSKNYNER